MNKLVLIFISILIFLLCYYQINKIKENFTSTDINNKDIIPESTEDTLELIKRHQVDYAKKIYDTNFLFDNYGKLMITKNQISFWEPLIDSTIYSLGTAVSDNLEKPTSLYTAVEGSELINPVEFKMLYRFGGLKNNLINKIKILTESLPTYIDKRDNLQKILDIYNNSDPRYHISKAWAIHKPSDIYYMVLNDSHWITNWSSYNAYPTQWYRFKSIIKLWGLSNIDIPPYMNISIVYPVWQNGSWISTNKIITAWDYNKTIKYGKNIDKIDTILPVSLDLTQILQNNMKHNIILQKYEKNIALGELWQKELDNNNKEIERIQNEINILTNELNNGIFSIWRPTPPQGYNVFGDILSFGHGQPMISEIKCVPERCTKETRYWDIQKDRKLVIEDNNIRVSFFRNPFHMTLHIFIEEKVDNRWQYIGENPEKSKILRIYPCVPKCDYVDDLVKANNCSKNMCINKKKLFESTPLTYRKSSIEAENIMLEEIKEQDLLLENLKKIAQEIETKQNKFNIVNQEFNRHEFSKYIKDQSDLHWDTIDKLYKTRNGVAVNINSPGGLETLKTMLKDYLKNHAKQLQNKTESQTVQGKTGEKCTNWTEFKQNHRCKYNDPPCFGCVNPT
jgi:hypothetical protein